MPDRWNDMVGVMGQDPMAVLECFADLGLNDEEIARYFGLTTADLGWLRKRAARLAAKP